MSFEGQIAALDKIVEELQQRWNQIQIVGRVLTPEEEQELETIAAALTLVRQARQVLAGPGQVQEIPLVDGRYTGGNGELEVELRLDEELCGIISGDLFRVDAGSRTWVASLRTFPDDQVELDEGAWEIVVEDVDQLTTVATLALEGQVEEPLTLVGRLYLDEPVAGISGQVEIVFTATYAGQALRSLGIEMESQVSIAPLESYQHQGETVTIHTALAEAGIETYNVGLRSTIDDPPNPKGWGTAELHALMVDHAEATLAAPAWEVHLLMLDRSTRSGLLGVMFDTTSELPRQGSAVFAGKMRELFPDDSERQLIRTTVHEIGHALNLVHRYERVVGRADSLSFMNYSWRYRGGGHEDEYWSLFDFTFDPDELSFLRHAPRDAIIPGGSGFHAVPYWTEGGGGYVPYGPEVLLADMELVLSGPESGLVFDFLQPVFLQVELFNHSGVTLSLYDWMLDPKAGALEVIVRRVSGGDDDNADVFVPVMQRCFDITGSTADEVPDGGAISGNLNLTYGSAGFTFAEPGEYEVQAIIVLSMRDDPRELVIPSNSLRLRVAYPKTRHEEEDALTLLRDDVGLYFALGGSRVLEEVRDDLEEIRLRRQGKAARVRDGVCASIVRCAGIDSGRSYLRRRAGKAYVDEGSPAQAADWLEQLDRRALRFFDRDTARGTEALAKKHRKRA
jgi:hypothetical protein